MKRAKLRGLKRNAAVVLGNVGNGDDNATLAATLEDSDPLVREHANWALGRISTRAPSRVRGTLAEPPMHTRYADGLVVNLREIVANLGAE